MAKTRKPARYPGKMTLVTLSIRNCPPKEMCEKVNAVPFLAYHVETLADGRKVCITKPGGKATWGRMKANDFMVWIYDEAAEDRWRISHEEIYEDIRAKLTADSVMGGKVVDLLHRVCQGAEPDDLTEEFSNVVSLPGFPPDLIMKVYKWIWTQEDCNYPTGEGRWMSMKGILKLRDDHLNAGAGK